MSVKKRFLIGLAVALAVAVAISFALRPASDEDQIKKTMGSFASLVSTKPNDSITSRMMRMRSHMSEVVRDDVSVRVEELHIDLRGRAKLEEEAAKAGLVYQDAECTFVNTKLRIDPARTLAQVDTTALVTANVGGERKVDKRPVHLLLRNQTGGGWLIDTMDVSQPTGD